MLELYHSPISTCSQKVRLVLAEKNLPWTSRMITFADGDHLKPDYLKINPNGVVPTLVDGGDPIIDSSVINEYLEDVYPDIPLRPHEPKARARMRAWRQYIDEVPTPAIRPPSFNAYFVPIWAKLSDEQFEAYANRLPLRKHFYKKMGRTGFSEQDIAEALDKLRQTLERMEQSLALGPWLNGDDYTRRCQHHADHRAHGRPRPVVHVERPAEGDGLVQAHQAQAQFRYRLHARIACPRPELLKGKRAIFYRGIPAPARWSLSGSLP